MHGTCLRVMRRLTKKVRQGVRSPTGKVASIRTRRCPPRSAHPVWTKARGYGGRLTATHHYGYRQRTLPSLLTKARPQPLEDSPCVIPFSSPVLQPCCVVLYLPSVADSFRAATGVARGSFRLFVSPPHGVQHCAIPPFSTRSSRRGGQAEGTGGEGERDGGLRAWVGL